MSADNRLFVCSCEKTMPLDANARFTELQKRKIDVLSRNSTWSMSRETNYDLYFPAVAYYDGEGFMVPASRNVTVAVVGSTETSRNWSVPGSGYFVPSSRNNSTALLPSAVNCRRRNRSKSAVDCGTST